MILITGGSGLLGLELISQLLSRGEKLIALYHNKPIPINHPMLQHFHGSILDIPNLEKAMEGVEKIYHCAALVSFDPVDDEKLFKINVEGTANVVNVALAAGVRKILHVSSVAALGRLRKGETINEKMQWSPATSNSRYGETKYLGEMEVWRGVAEGLEGVVINPVIILGPGNWHEGSTKIFKSVYDEIPWYSEGVTGFVDVRDVCEAMIMLMESTVTSERFILSAENRDYRSVFNLIAKHFNKRPPTKVVTPAMASIVWRVEKIKSLFTRSKPFITKETATTALAKSFFDNSKLLLAFPAFKYKPLEQTISETCAVLQQKVNSR
jgi:nucleoside-diphosphate-sugar epimerase